MALEDKESRKVMEKLREIRRAVSPLSGPVSWAASSRLAHLESMSLYPAYLHDANSCALAVVVCQEELERRRKHDEWMRANWALMEAEAHLSQRVEKVYRAWVKEQRHVKLIANEKIWRKREEKVGSYTMKTVVFRCCPICSFLWVTVTSC